MHVQCVTSSRLHRVVAGGGIRARQIDRLRGKGCHHCHHSFHRNNRFSAATRAPGFVRPDGACTRSGHVILFKKDNYFQVIQTLLARSNPIKLLFNNPTT